MLLAADIFDLLWSHCWPLFCHFSALSASSTGCQLKLATFSFFFLVLCFFAYKDDDNDDDEG